MKTNFKTEYHAFPMTEDLHYIIEPDQIHPTVLYKRKKHCRQTLKANSISILRRANLYKNNKIIARHKWRVLIQ